jgi:hypothetical protein
MAQSGLQGGVPPEVAEEKIQAMLALFKSKTLTNTMAQPGDVAEEYLWLTRDRFVTGPRPTVMDSWRIFARMRASTV